MRNAKLLSASLLAGIVLVMACVKRVEISPASSMGASLTLEQFLAAANAKDLTAMGNLMGTKQAPINKLDDKTVLEPRMHLIATVLMHDDYKIEGEEIVPGRQGEAIKLNVNLVMGLRKVMVPFIMVHSKDGKWRVEWFAMENITMAR